MLGLPHAREAIEIRCVWTADGDRAALSTTYLPDPPGAGPGELGASSLEDTLNFVSLASTSAARTAVRAEALHVEVQPPAPAAARTLRLAPGVSALTVTVRFSGACPGSPRGIDSRRAPSRSVQDHYRVRGSRPAGHPGLRTRRCHRLGSGSGELRTP